MPSGLLRSSAIEILGSGFGSIPAEAMKKMPSETLPEMFQLAANGKLKIDTVTGALKDIETAWQEHIPAGKRLVIVIE